MIVDRFLTVPWCGKTRVVSLSLISGASSTRFLLQIVTIKKKVKMS